MAVKMDYHLAGAMAGVMAVKMVVLTAVWRAAASAGMKVEWMVVQKAALMAGL